MIDVKKVSPAERDVILARRAYMRKWREENPEKVRAAKERFFKRKAEKLTAEQQENKKPSE